MKLIIIDDSFLALKGMVELVRENNIVEDEEIKCIKCGQKCEGEALFPNDIEINQAKHYEDLISTLENVVSIQKEDRLLIDVELFEEKESEVEFSEFGSVKCAMHFVDIYPTIRCKFYSVIYGATRLDFARETNYKWGEPLLRPIFTDTAMEKNKKNNLIEEIRRLCND